MEGGFQCREVSDAIWRLDNAYKKGTYLVSMDYSRAFDAAAPDLCLLAWERLGG